MSGRPTQFASKTGVGTTGIFLCSNDRTLVTQMGDVGVPIRSIAKLRGRSLIAAGALQKPARNGEYTQGVNHEYPAPALVAT